MGGIYYPAFPYTSYQRMQMDDVRDLFAFLKTLPAVQAGPRPRTNCCFPSTSGARSAAGNSCSSTANTSGPIRRTRQNGIAAPIWSTVQATARNAIQPRNMLGVIIASQRFAGGPDPEGGDGWVPNITQAGLEQLFRAGHRALSDDRRVCQTAIRSAATWARSSAIIAQLRPRRSRRDCGLHQIAAGGREPEAVHSGDPVSHRKSRSRAAAERAQR